MSHVTNALTQTAQIKPQLNKPNNWIEWNQKLNNILAIINLWKVLIKDKALSVDTDFENYAT